jgi:hypothetical protein
MVVLKTLEFLNTRRGHLQFFLEKWKVSLEKNCFGAFD